MRYWLELRTALALARLGTVSAAAKEIGVHRSTINRQIDTLEAAFKTRLFQRHARGYSLTPTGRDIIAVAEQADAMFSDMQARQRSAADLTSGTLTITAVSGIAPILTPIIRSFQREHPHIQVEFIADAKLLNLETGEAHIAFRGGEEPTDLDYIVQQFRTIHFALYASQGYIDEHGFPEPGALNNHRFVAPFPESAYPPYQEWFAENTPANAIVLTSGSRHVREIAICNGVGIGFIDEFHASCLKGLVEIARPNEGFPINVWTLTHVDLHRTPNIQAFLDHLRA